MIVFVFLEMSVAVEEGAVKMKSHYLEVIKPPFRALL